MEDPPLSWNRPFECELPGDLPKEDQIIGDPSGVSDRFTVKCFLTSTSLITSPFFLPVPS